MTTIYTPRASDVRINEIDATMVVGSNSITVAAQIIVSTQGDTRRPLPWTNPDSYIDHYGIPNAQVSFDVYGGRDYFREGSELWGFRVVGAGATWAALLAEEDAQGLTKLTPIPLGVVNPEQVDFADLASPGHTPLFMFFPKRGPGSYARKYAVELESPNIGQLTGASVTSSLSSLGTLGPGTYEYQVSALSETGETLSTAPISVVIATGAPTTHENTLTWNAHPQASAYFVYGRVAGAGYGRLVQVGQVNTPTVTFIDRGTVTPDVDIQPITDPADLPEPSKSFIVNIYDTEVSTGFPQESFPVTLEESTDNDGINTEIEERINPFSMYLEVVSNVPSLPNPDAVNISSVAQTNLGGGDSGNAPTEFDVAAAWSVFKNKELYKVNTLLNTGHSTPEVGHAMEELARRRGDSVALLDTPSTSQQYMQAINYRKLELNLNSSYAALFCPDVEEADEFNGKRQFVPFSGWAGALCARTDRVANPSFSIAGLNRGLVNVLRSRYTYDDGEASMLFKSQVNYTRTFIGQGIALWEQKTMQVRDSAFSWLSVRRIVNVIKVSLYDFGLYILQEQNDDFTRRQLVTSFSDYLDALVNARALHSHRVTATATPTEEIQGILRATVQIVPVIPIHELQIDVVLTKRGAEFLETERPLGT